MTTARSQIVVEGEVGVYHTESRCVRRAFLCGLDKLTGQNFEHRRGWVESRLAFVATDAFSVDILSFSILENHWHGVLRTRPDLAEELTDEEVAHRWVRLFPGKRGAIDPSVTPILEAVDINVANWVEGVEHYGTRTCRVVGHIEAICRAAANSTVKFFKGRKLCEELFASPIPAPG